MSYYKLLLVSIFILTLNILFLKSGFIDHINYRLYDAISSMVPKKQSIKSSVVVVDIDEKSLDALGQWPWSRVVLAKLIEEIDSADPASIGLDIVFAERDRTSPIVLKDFYKKYFTFELELKGLPEILFDNDKIFANTLRESNVALAIFLNSEYKKKEECRIATDGLKIKDDSMVKLKVNSALCNIEGIQASSKNTGFINASASRDGIFRKKPLFIRYNDKIVPSLGLATLMGLDSIKLDGDSIEILGSRVAMGLNSEVFLRFYDSSWYQKISAVDVLAGKIDSSLLKGKFILLGASAIGLHDWLLISNGERLPSAYIHATLIDNILNDSLSYELENVGLLNFILANLLLLALLYLVLKKRYIEFVVTFVAASVLSVLISYIFLFKGIYISVAYFIAPFVIGFFVINTIAAILQYLEKQLFYSEISRAHSLAIDSMALVVESRDIETGAHIKRTKLYIKLLCSYMLEKGLYRERLSQEFSEIMYRASPLHDIGKVAIPDTILKKPGRLTREEFEVMKTHAIIGKNILDNALIGDKDNKFLKVARNIAHYHHEKWDGTGYPQGLKGKNIPIEGRIMAIADVYDALTSKRVYKESFDFEIAEEIIVNEKGNHFDPLLVEIFMELKEEFKEIAIREKE